MTKAAIPQQYDLIGTEINIDSYVVSASGNGNVIIAKVTRIWDKKGHSNTRQVRVDLEVVISPELIAYHNRSAAHRSFYAPPKTATAKIENVMVITPDMKQLAMIAKLAM